MKTFRSDNPENDFRAYDLLKKGVLSLSRAEHIWLARHFHRTGNFGARDTAMHNARLTEAASRSEPRLSFTLVPTKIVRLEPEAN